MSTYIELTTKEGRQVIFNVRNIEAIFTHQSLSNVVCIQTVAGEEWHIVGDMTSIISMIPKDSW